MSLATHTVILTLHIKKCNTRQSNMWHITLYNNLDIMYFQNENVGLFLKDLAQVQFQLGLKLDPLKLGHLSCDGMIFEYTVNIFYI